MASRFGNEDEEDDVLAPKEPQVTSQDPEERKAGRALRIKRRQEALKRADQPLEEAAAEEEPGQIELATAAAAEELQRLALDGAAKVTNVKVTTDEREVIRRTQFFKNMDSSIQKIEEEAADAQLQYDVISANWDQMLSIRDPLDIDYEMKEQKKKCDALLQQKDVLITELKSDLKKMDQAYFIDLEKQDNDIKELSERIEKQITIMQRAYAKQLSLIEQAITFEREAMIDHNNKRWEALYKQRDKEEVNHMEYRFEQSEEYKRDLETIMWEHHEKYRDAKIKLESLIQELQQELEKLKATCIINTEKIGYTYQVLKKREEENVFVRSQQKRKLNKMSDITNTLRAKIRKAAEDGAIEEVKADAEIVKLMQTMEDLEKKSDQFSYVNHNKFAQVWRMSAAKCLELSKQIRQGEVALHAHILAEPAPPPPAPPPKSPLTKYEHEMANKNSDLSKPRTTHNVDPENVAASEAKESLVRHILQLVADNTGFLVEDRLLKLIEKYQTCSQNLCTLDAIFMALEIHADEDIELLCDTILNYAFCPVCVGLEVASEGIGQSTLLSSSQEMLPTTESPLSRGRGDRLSMRGRTSLAAVRSNMSSTTSRAHIAFRRSHGISDLSPADQILIQEADEIIQKCGGDPQVSAMTVGTPSDSQIHVKRTGRGVTVAVPTPTTSEAKPKSPYLCPLGHVLEIESMQILAALNDFIAAFVPSEKRKLHDIMDSLKPPSFETASRKLTTEEIEQYWIQWKNMFSPEKDKFWDGLLTGLNHYLSVLQERERLHEEVVQLRRRNTALRRLVRGALPDISAPVPHYLRSAPAAFAAATTDSAPPACMARLPPI